MKNLNQSYKSFIVISFIICAFFLTQGCTKRTCRDVNYIEGVSYRNGKLFTGECITNHLNNTIKNDKQRKVILFSPCAASFDQFKNFEERGKFFNKSIQYIFKQNKI